MRKEELDRIEKGLVVMAAFGAGLTAYGVARGAAEVVDTLYENITTITDTGSNLQNAIAKNPVLKLLGYGRKGGFI